MVDHDPWVGDTPYFLLLASLEPNEGGAFGHLVLDVDKTGWQVEYRDWLERSAEWYLCDKVTQRVLLAMVSYRGEHPYYLKRHVGQVRLNDSASRSVEVYGIGKKVPNVYENYEETDARGDTATKRRLLKRGRTERLWLLPSGVVCGGEDIEKLALAIVSSMEWQREQDEGSRIIEGTATEVRDEVAGE